MSSVFVTLLITIFLFPQALFAQTNQCAFLFEGDRLPIVIEPETQFEGFNFDKQQIILHAIFLQTKIRNLEPAKINSKKIFDGIKLIDWLKERTADTLNKINSAQNMLELRLAQQELVDLQSDYDSLMGSETSLTKIKQKYLNFEMMNVKQSPDYQFAIEILGREIDEHLFFMLSSNAHITLTKILERFVQVQYQLKLLNIRDDVLTTSFTLFSISRNIKPKDIANAYAWALKELPNKSMTAEERVSLALEHIQPDMGLRGSEAKKVYLFLKKLTQN